VLLVEDDTNVRNFITRALNCLGYNVTSADCGEEALKLLVEGKVCPDMLVTDVVMTGMNGRQMVDKILEMIPDLPVLYISGYADEMTNQQGVLEDGIILLEKPFSITALTSKMREFLDKKL